MSNIIAQKKPDMFQVYKIVLEEDLSPFEKISLLRMLFGERRATDGVVVNRLAAIGYARIRSEYTEWKGRLSWVKDAIEIYPERDMSLSVWLIIYKTEKAKKKMHSVLISAHSEEEAIEEWRFAWPNHQMISIENVSQMSMDDFAKSYREWLLPMGAVALPLAMANYGKRQFEHYADKSFFYKSQLTQERKNE